MQARREQSADKALVAGRQYLPKVIRSRPARWPRAWLGRMRCCAKYGGCSHRAGPPASSSPPRPSRRSSSPPAEVISTVGLLDTFCDSAISTVPEKRADTTDSHVAEVGVDAQQIPAPGEQHKQGRDCERRHERARKTAQRREKMEPRGSGRWGAVPPSLRNRLRLAHPPPTR